MPLVEYLAGHFVLKCPNYHGIEYMPPSIIRMDTAGAPIPPKTTMEELPGWQIIPRALDEEERVAGPQEPETLAAWAVCPTRGLPVRLFMCRECGFVEMYADTKRSTDG